MASEGDPKTIPLLPCACANLRRAVRAVTSLYDKDLQGSGLRTTQFTFLLVLCETGEITQGRLGRVLVMDSTTLSRSLSPLLRQGLIADRRGRDRRERWLRLTDLGERQLKKLYPRWKRSQSRFKRLLGGQDWGHLTALLYRLTRRMSERKELP